jgi:hypothetical protein
MIVTKQSFQEPDAMTSLSSFQTRFATLIIWVLSCFDRVIFKGYLPISRPYEFERFVDGIPKMRRVDFLKVVAPQWSDRIVEHSKSLAQKHGRTWEYAAGVVDKDAWAKARLQEQPLTTAWSGCCA